MGWKAGGSVERARLRDYKSDAEEQIPAKFVLRVTQGPTPGVIAFHFDGAGKSYDATYTSQIALTDEDQYYKGGRLVFFAPENIPENERTSSDRDDAIDANFRFQ